MGSLMAGWDSPVSDPTSVLRERNRSLTKEGIEAYWRSKKKTEEEHLRAILLQTHFSLMDYDLPSLIKYFRTKEAIFEKYERRSNSNTWPILDMDAETNPENIINKTGWWRRSNWAFLNEPPVVDLPTNSYKPQFQIAKLAVSKLNEDYGISV